MPKVSVIMPVYNTKEEYLKEAIESILNQTFADWELIAIDNGSYDYVKNIIKSYTDNRIKYQRVEANIGPANARNLGIKQAQGKYIAFLDSDDISLPNRLEVQYEFLEKNYNIGCLGTNAYVINNVTNRNKSNALSRPLKNEDIEKYLLFVGCPFYQSSIMLRKEILDKNNISYNDEYVPAEDYCLWLNLLGRTKFEILQASLVKYRFYSDNVSSKQKHLQNKKATTAKFSAIEKYYNINIPNKDILISLSCFEDFSIRDIQKLNLAVIRFFELMEEKKVSKDLPLIVFKRKFKNLYYHIHSLSGQWQLLRSPLNRFFKLSLIWRLTCFITRGVL